MIRNPRFWIVAALFQIAFGLAVFGLTRQYYSRDTDELSPEAARVLQSLPDWPDRIPGTATVPAGGAMDAPATSSDTMSMSRNADEFFASGQYDKAAELYRQLLAVDPPNVETYNNLGLTLHYLGKSAEALTILTEGVALNPAHQRIWLTTGFVNTQLGRTTEARSALTKAQVGTDEEIRQSALEMLQALP